MLTTNMIRNKRHRMNGGGSYYTGGGSRGRRMPIAPQATVAINAYASQYLFEERSRTLHPTYPVGEARNFDVCKGEIAFSVVTPAKDRVPTMPNMSDMCVATCVNGMKMDDPIRFAGLVLKGCSPEEGKDPMVSLRRSGTGTAVNTGPHTISEGSMVYVKFPAWKEDANGNRIPVHRQDGIPPGKFILETHGLKVEDIFQQFLNITTRFNAEVAKLVHNNNPNWQPHEPTDGLLDTDALRDAVADIHAPYSLLHGNQREVDPTWRCVQFLLACQGAGNMNWYRDGRDAEILHHTERIQRAGKAVGRLTGVPDALNRRAVADPFAAPLAVAAVPPNDGDISGNPTAFMHFIVKFCMEQEEILRNMAIGVCLNTSAPNQPLNLNMGCFRS